MSGSFRRTNPRIERIILESQTQWRKGYNLGMTGKKGSVPDLSYLSGADPSFVDGYKRALEEKSGVVIRALPAPKFDAEKIAKEQFARGCHVAHRDDGIPETVLAKCHPEFVHGYRKTLCELDQNFNSQYDCLEDD